ncbi:MAG: hypothetical protein R6X32_17485 [Chloroflexota bacterium]
MNKTLLVIGTILAGIGLFVGGFFFSQVNAQDTQPGWMMGNWNNQVSPDMMGSWEGQYGPNMMGGGQYDGMMMGGQYGSGMMGSYDAYADVEPLSIAEAETAVTNYLATLNDENLSLGEIMIFDNNAYAQIMNSETGQGAFEVLVDPTTRNVFPEPGPNMMWNTEYGMMSGGNYGMMGSMMNGQYGSGMMGQYDSDMMGEDQYGGMMGGNMMGNFGYAPDAEINITAEDAVGAAQVYLDAYLPGKTAEDHADTFPGYYTLHILENGETIGMLSVNAYTGQVFLHHWHGTFIEMTGGEQA